MPAEAIRSPRRAASVANSLRNSTTCSRAHCDVGANLGSKLDDRLVHLRLDVLFQRHFAIVKNLLNVGTQLARFRIDDLEFLLDPEGEYVR